MDRRSFLGRSTLMGAGLALRPESVLATADPKEPLIVTPGASSFRHSEQQAIIPDDGWRLWPDRTAEWKNDTVYLPEDVDLATLPVNSPSGGWSALSSSAGIAVTLPATVEQFFWGLTGLRAYKDEYKFEATDDEVKNGAYYGVSWWWRDLTIPRSYTGQRVLLHIRGVRQRAEVYLNQKLVGYTIMEELPFTCDLTDAMRPGKRNQLALRITNPGGRLDWVDNVRMTWGGLEIQKSHGFGGIDRGMLVSAHGPVRFADTWALNTPIPKQVRGYAVLENNGAQPVSGTVRFTVISQDGKGALASRELPATIPAKGTTRVEATLDATSAEIWDLTTPHVYKLRTEWIESNKRAALREVDFGFRWIAPEGIGKNALFRLNGRRIRIYTSISWGYWALNGLFPTPELSEKEVRVAKQFNLNTLNFHRNLGKEDVLYIQDRLGLMRCLEPGGGAQGFAPQNPGQTSAKRYMEAKITGMIRAFRSHPSVVHYIIQNETTLDPQSPEVAALFALMQREDPSRTIVGNDGFVMRAPQAWAEPYSTEMHRSAGKATEEGGAGGWWVDHTGHFSDVWQDTYYRNPRDFYYRSSITGEIVEWGEMKGAAAPDNHVGLLHQIQRHGGFSYDKQDHQEQLAAYEHFLDQWNFRAVFPSTEQLFLSIGRRAYESWGQFMENVRICDQNDMAAISGWESTAMENHSGLVDNYRDFKADPRSLSVSLQPVRPVAKQRQLVLNTGEQAIFDLYLLNDTDAPVTGTLSFTLSGPGTPSTTLATVQAPAFERDKFAYFLQEGLQTPTLAQSGEWRTHFTLSTHPEASHELTLLVVDRAPARFRPLRIGLADVSPTIQRLVHTIPQITAEPFAPGTHYDVILGSGGAADASKNLAVDAEGAYKPGAGPLQEFTLPEAVLTAVRNGTPLLAITPTDGQSVGVAKQLGAAGAFTYKGMVGPSRASWMGSWYFVREHPLYDGMPVNQAMSIHYQVKAGGSNGWLVEGSGVELIAGYSRDHDRNIGAGSLIASVGNTPVVLHRIPDMHPILLQRFISNALLYLADQVKTV